jgi:hypothetical protein
MSSEIESAGSLDPVAQMLELLYEELQRQDEEEADMARLAARHGYANLGDVARRQWRVRMFPVLRRLTSEGGYSWPPRAIVRRPSTPKAPSLLRRILRFFGRRDKTPSSPP